MHNLNLNICTTEDEWKVVRREEKKETRINKKKKERKILCNFFPGWFSRFGKSYNNVEWWYKLRLGWWWMMTLHGGGASGGGRTLCRVRKERREGTGGNLGVWLQEIYSKPQWIKSKDLIVRFKFCNISIKCPVGSYSFDVVYWIGSL